jgi:hypothetical protein
MTKPYKGRDNDDELYWNKRRNSTLQENDMKYGTQTFNTSETSCEYSSLTPNTSKPSQTAKLCLIRGQSVFHAMVFNTDSATMILYCPVTWVC